MNKKTDFDKFVDYVERKMGIEFYGDLDELDAIADYKDLNDRDMDYLIGSIDDEEGMPIVTVSLGHSFGKRGDEDFLYVVEPEADEPIYEEGLTDWKEAAEKAVAAIKKYMNFGVNESNRRYGNPLFEDIEVTEPHGNPFKVGDILAGTWGYSMTIPMFVQVIGVTPKSVRCRQLRVLNDNGFQGHDAMARKDDFEPENRNFPNTFLARVKGEPGEEYVMCPSPRCYLRPWNGRGLPYDHMD